MRAVAVLRIFVLDWHIEQRISGMVGGNIGFSISDIRAPDDQAALLGGDSKTIRGLGNSANKDRPEAVKYTRHALSWQGFGSSRAADGAALTISDVESGSLLSGLVFPLCLQPELGGFTV